MTETANRVIADLLLLDADDRVGQIDLYINSPGGSVLDGLAIIDTIRCIQAPVSSVCIGRAASMAAWILASGEEGLRLASPNAEIMIHGLAGEYAAEENLGLRATGKRGAVGFHSDSPDQRIYAQRLKQWQQRLVAMLATWTGRTREQIEADIKNDFFLSATEARDYGLVDGILEPFKA